MSLADKLKKRNEEREVKGKHPLVSMRLSSDVRNAYFNGIALAALVDDGSIDETERNYLNRLGCSLNLNDAEIGELISTVQECKSEDDQLSLFDEVAIKLEKPEIRKLFLAEFSLVWKSHSSKLDELAVYRTEMARQFSLRIPDDFWKQFDLIFEDQVKAAQTGRRLDGFDDGMMTYLFPAYSSQKTTDSKKDEADPQLSCGVPDFLTNFKGLFGLATEPTTSKMDPASSIAKVRVVPSLCTACGACLTYCPHSAIDVIGDNFSINDARCAKCGTCIPKCPTGAIVRGESVTESYYIILRNSGPNVNSIAEIVKEITGLRGADARSIVMAGGRCLRTQLSYEKALQYKKRLQSIGATADVVKV